MITVHFEPKKSTLTFPTINTVLQLLGKLNLRVNDALIVRGDECCTPG
jgi:sulfur carrier protein